MKKMLVVAPHPFFTPRGTPLSVYYRTLVAAEQGVPIDLLTYGSGNDVNVPGVRIVRIPRIRAFEPIPVGPSLRKLCLDVLMVIWTIALLIRTRHEVVHAHEESVFWCRFLKPVFGFRLIYDMHSSLPQQLENFRFTRFRWPVRLFAALESSCLKSADAVITICPDLRDLVLKSGVPNGQHLLIENSIFDEVNVTGASSLSSSACALSPDERFPTPRSDLQPRTILYAGTFEAYQGVDLLIRAFAIARRSVPARLVLAGGSPQQVRRMREIAEIAGVLDDCHFNGQVSKSVAMSLTRTASLLVSPRTHGTNTPLKIYEQIASGVPLVATRIYSHTQVLDESVCFFVDPDPQSMAIGLLDALQNPQVAHDKATSAASLYAREYSRPIYVSKMRELLLSVGIKTPAQLKASIRKYWDLNVERWAIATHRVGSPDYFQQIESYRFEKLDYLERRIRFDAYEGQRVLEVGCGLGNDLSRFARGGANVTGIDLSPRAIELARRNFEQRNLEGHFEVMDGEALDLPDASFDLVYCHTVLHFTPNPAAMVSEIARVLRPNGLAILMAVNRRSWMNWLRHLMKVEIDHLDAPVIRHMTRHEFAALMAPFSDIRLISERFPVPTQVHRGIKAQLYNWMLVPLFRQLPRSLVERSGHHLLAICRKAGR